MAQALRNYLIGHAELGLDLTPVLAHFSEILPEDHVVAVAAEVLEGPPQAPGPTATTPPEVDAGAAGAAEPATLTQGAGQILQSPLLGRLPSPLLAILLIVFGPARIGQMVPDYPRSWLGHQLGSVSEEINRHFGHRSFLHSLLALVLITLVLGAPLWRITGNLAPAVAIFVGFGSHLFADMMTLGGVQLFWPRQTIAVFPGRDEYRVVTGSGSEAVFIAVAFVLAGLFYPVSRMGFDGLLYSLGGADQVYGKVTKVTDGDTISVEVYGQRQPVRLIGVDTPETVAIGQPVGCYGKEASNYTKRELTDRLIRLEIPRIGDSEDAYGRTLAYVYLDADKDGSYEHAFNEDLIVLGLARTTTFSHTYRRKFERLREEAEERGMGLWSACPDKLIS